MKLKLNPDFKKVFILFWPILLEVVLMNLLNSVDTLMLSYYDVLCVDASGSASSTISMLSTLLIISSNGVAIIVGQFLGAKKQEEAKGVLSQGVFANFFLGLLLAILFYFLGGYLLKLANTKDSFFDLALTYLKIYALALPFQAVNQVIAANFRAYKKPMVSTVVSIASNLLNILLNYFLIFGVWIFPEMGIKGAAIATLVSFIFKMICLVILEKRILKCPIFPRMIRKDILLGILKIGGPSALETVTYTISSFILLSAVNLLSEEEIACRVYIMLVTGYVCNFSSAFASANAIIVARYTGAHEYDKAKKLTLEITGIALVVAMLLVGLINLIGRPLFGAISQNESYLEIILPLLPYLFLLEFGRCVNMVIIGAQKAAGDVYYPLMIAIISMSLVMGGGSYLFSQVFELRVAGILLAAALDELLRGILSFARWLKGSWQNKSLVKEDPIDTN